MGGVVVAVNQEVCGAGMVRVVPEYSLGDRGGAEVRRNVANALAQAEQRDAIQHLGLAVRREGRDKRSMAFEYAVSRAAFAPSP